MALRICSNSRKTRSRIGVCCRLCLKAAVFSGVAYYFIVRDTPEELGFRSPNKDDAENRDSDNTDNERKAVGENDANVDEGTFERYMATLSNWRFLTACISLGFESMARHGLLIWVPAYYLGEGWKDNPSTTWLASCALLQ